MHFHISFATREGMKLWKKEQNTRFLQKLALIAGTLAFLQPTAKYSSIAFQCNLA